MGSNIDPEQNLRKAAVMLRNKWKKIRFSSIYASTPQEVEQQASFLNAAAMLETDLSPKKVAATLGSIEKALKKNPPYRFGPRTIDLDLLLYDDFISLDDTLTIPHLCLHRRRFVLEPLLELGAGDVVHPAFDRKLRSYLPNVKKQECKKTELRYLT